MFIFVTPYSLFLWASRCEGWKPALSSQMKDLSFMSQCFKTKSLDCMNNSKLIASKHLPAISTWNLSKQSATPTCVSIFLTDTWNVSSTTVQHSQKAEQHYHESKLEIYTFYTTPIMSVGLFLPTKCLDWIPQRDLMNTFGGSIWQGGKEQQGHNWPTELCQSPWPQRWHSYVEGKVILQFSSSV